jgi:hypothetical protein
MKQDKSMKARFVVYLTLVTLLFTGITKIKAQEKIADVCSIDLTSALSNDDYPFRLDCESHFVDADACMKVAGNEGCDDWNCTRGVHHNDGDGIFGSFASCYEDKYIDSSTCRTPDGSCVVLYKYDREITPYRCGNQADRVYGTIFVLNQKGCDGFVAGLEQWHSDEVIALIRSDCHSKCHNGPSPVAPAELDSNSGPSSAAAAASAAASAMVAMAIVIASCSVGVVASVLL